MHQFLPSPSNPVVPAVACAAAVVLLAWARRGRRVDRHPVCRKCRFDLHGLPDGVKVCSECGADLTHRRAVRAGNRTRRRRTAGLAVLLLVAAVAWLGADGWSAAEATDWQAHKPVWMLRREAGGPDPKARDAAIGQLARRLDQGRLTAEQVGAVADLALAAQADRHKTWTPQWGDFVERAHDTGRLGDDKWERYAWQAANVSLHVRERVRRGDPVDMEVLAFVDRAGSSVRFRARATPVMLDGRLPVNADPAVDRPVPMAFDVSQLGKLPDGPQTTTLSARVSIFDKTGNFDAPLVEREVRLRDSWTLLPASVPSTTLRQDEAARQAIQSSARVAGVWLTPRGYDGVDLTGATVRLWLTPARGSSAPWTPLAYEVWLRCGDVEWRMDETVAVAVWQDLDGRWFDVTGRAPRAAVAAFEGEGARVDVVLRPSLAAAAATTSLTEILDGEVTLPGVIVRRGEAAALRRGRLPTGRPTTSPARRPPAPQGFGAPPREARPPSEPPTRP